MFCNVPYELIRPICFPFSFNSWATFCPEGKTERLLRFLILQVLSIWKHVAVFTVSPNEYNASLIASSNSWLKFAFSAFGCETKPTPL